MASFVIRRKLTSEEADILVNTAQQFFKDNPRRRVFRVGDDSGVWFKVRRAFISEDIQVRTANRGCPACGSDLVEQTKEGKLFCYKCAIEKMLAK